MFKLDYSDPVMTNGWVAWSTRNWWQTEIMDPEFYRFLPHPSRVREVREVSWGRDHSVPSLGCHVGVHNCQNSSI